MCLHNTTMSIVYIHPFSRLSRSLSVFINGRGWVYRKITYRKDTTAANYVFFVLWPLHFCVSLKHQCTAPVFRGETCATRCWRRIYDFRYVYYIIWFFPCWDMLSDSCGVRLYTTFVMGFSFFIVKLFVIKSYLRAADHNETSAPFFRQTSTLFFLISKQFVICLLAVIHFVLENICLILYLYEDYLTPLT